jgi:hypothetical protein
MGLFAKDMVWEDDLFIEMHTKVKSNGTRGIELKGLWITKI